MTKALTLTQPWATLVALGIKKVETRSWSTRYRGPLLIHAAKGMTVGDLAFAHELRRDAVIPPERVVGALGVASMSSSRARGVLLARVQLVDVVRVETVAPDLAPAELRLGDYRPGRFAWLLDDAEPLPEPIPWRGALGLWNGPDL